MGALASYRMRPSWIPPPPAPRPAKASSCERWCSTRNESCAGASRRLVVAQAFYLGLAQVEPPLYPPARLVLELAADIELVDELPLLGDHLTLDVVEKIHTLLVCVVVMAAQFYLTQMVEAVRAQTCIDIFRYVVLGRLPIETIDDRLDGPAAGLVLSGSPLHTLAAAGIGESEFLDHPRQREALTDQRHQHDDECEEQNQIAMRERCAIIGRQRDGERRGERDDSTDTGVSEHERPLPRRRRILAGDGGYEPARKIGGRIHPYESSADDDGADDCRGDDQFRGGMAFNPDSQSAGLQTGEQEHHTLDHVDEEIPEKDTLQSRRGTDQSEPVPADVQSRGDGGQHAGAAQVLRWPVGNERRQHGEQDLDARVADPAAQTQHQPAGGNAPEDLADHNGDERAHRAADRENPAGRRRHGKSVKDQRSGIVRESLSFENHDDSPG